MKKFFTLAIVSLLSTAAVQAQKVVINKADGTQVTFQASEITNVQFVPASLTDNFVGSYKGEDKISVGGLFSYTSDCSGGNFQKDHDGQPHFEFLHHQQDSL